LFDENIQSSKAKYFINVNLVEEPHEETEKELLCVFQKGLFFCVFG
jgi:hypothetical protein